MAKRKKAAKRNPRAPGEPTREIERAAERFRGFREIEPGHVSKLQLELPRAAMVVGELEILAYRTDHNGRGERYLHKFRKGCRPMLLASADGRQLLIYGGKFTFTDRGIVDGAPRRG